MAPLKQLGCWYVWTLSSAVEEILYLVSSYQVQLRFSRFQGFKVQDCKDPDFWWSFFGFIKIKAQFFFFILSHIGNLKNLPPFLFIFRWNWGAGVIAIRLVLWEFYFFFFQTCGFYAFIDISGYISLIGVMVFGDYLCWLIKWRFHDYYLLFYFREYGYQNLVSERVISRRDLWTRI